MLGVPAGTPFYCLYCFYSDCALRPLSLRLPAAPVTPAPTPGSAPAGAAADPSTAVITSVRRTVRGWGGGTALCGVFRRLSGRVWGGGIACASVPPHQTHIPVALDPALASIPSLPLAPLHPPIHPPPARTRQLLSTRSTGSTLHRKGVLTVTLKKATRLGGAPDTYATLSLYDPQRLPIPNIEFTTGAVWWRWGWGGGWERGWELGSAGFAPDAPRPPPPADARASPPLPPTPPFPSTPHPHIRCPPPTTPPPHPW